MPQTNRVWVITGTSTGFGRELAELLIAKGDKLVATARNLDAIADLKEKAPDRVEIARLDVHNQEEANQVVELAKSAFGRIDVLVNNAGYGLMGAFEEVSDEQIRHQFETNFFGLLNVTRSALPLMREQCAGHILNISSVVGQVGLPAVGIYSASKFAVEGFSEALAEELKPFGIKMTLIEPGGFRTEFAGCSLKHTQAMSEYRESTGAIRTYLEERYGTEPGDPKKAAEAMIKVVESENPPLHLPLGEDSLEWIQNKLEHQQKEMAEWKEVIISTAFESVSS